MTFDEAFSWILRGGFARRTDWNRPSHIERRSSPIAFIAMVMKDGKVGPYTPSHCDMLANDWVIVPC